MSSVDAVGRRVQEAFSFAPRTERLHVAGRLRSCPIDAVDSVLPSSGRVLEFGCGHGAVSLYLAMSAPDREMSGVDIDADKIALAREASTRGGVPVEFRQVPPDHRPTGTWDAVVIVDVLYLLGLDAAMDVLDHAARALEPNGVLVVKELDIRPKAKYWFALGQEVLATKVLRITEGSNLHIVDPALIGERLERAGLRVEQRPVHRRRLHPHHLIVARR